MDVVQAPTTDDVPFEDIMGEGGVPGAGDFSQG